VAAKANITYKLLYNDAVAMTGGQPVELPMTPIDMVRQLLSEGVKPVRLVSDHPEQYRAAQLPAGVSVHHRDALERIQRELREVPGVSAIVYEQTCAAEKRRRRKRGLMDDPEQRVLINPEVCEGCGDCSVQSNCISVQPLETEFGRKRTIDQSTCNKDYSCVNGFCPSFVTVSGAKIAARAAAGSGDLERMIAALPLPRIAALDDQGYNILIGGIGGTGVLTIGALIGMAAHLDGKGCTLLDMTGMAQKGGSVTSHIRIGADPGTIYTARLSEGMADLLIACDMIVGSGPAVLRTVRPGRTAAIVNTDVSPTGEFQSRNDMDLGIEPMRAAIADALDGGPLWALPASQLAVGLTGDSIATNVLMLGYALQQGLLPVSLASIEQAIRLNATAIDSNLRALAVGRVAAHSPDTLARALGDKPDTVSLASAEEVLESRTRLLTSYQHARYAETYRGFVLGVRRRLQARRVPGEAFVRQVALTLARLMAYKDEYEVARLYTDPKFMQRLREQFAGDFELTFHLAPPFLPGRDDRGRPKKRRFGAGTLSLFKLLASLKGLRGTAFDPFGYSAERRTERRLIGDYRALIDRITDEINPANLAAAVELAAAAGRIAGYGPVKDAALQAYEGELPSLLQAFESAQSQPRAA
jgi:indolepyruvate ferredoxin oxidoreductase